VPATDPVASEVPGGIAATALTYRGVRYRNGGMDPDDGFDCSGFVWYVFAQHGITVPRTVTDQYREGRQVDATELRSGDLVFFNTQGASPSHVGIALGGDQFVHAPSSTGEVRVERLSTTYWSGRFVGIRRFE
jgi:cell wall-associated NlpC family hydrolase